MVYLNASALPATIATIKNTTDPFYAATKPGEIHNKAFVAKQDAADGDFDIVGLFVCLFT
jgi:hypothetical protein